MLEICSGQTRFPLRPVTSTRFLIGAGDGCDLQLGGDDVPPLHSIVHLDHVEALLESVTLTPPLRVNGLVVESVLLQDGDRISIGPFELIAHRTKAAVASAPQSPRDIIVIGDDADESSSASQLSAAELATLIEEEELQVQSFAQRRELGANALLDAALERIDLEETADRDDGLAHLLEQANLLTAELQQRSAELADREAAQAELADAVFDTQQELSLRLESLVSRIVDLEQQQRPRYPKVA